MKHRYAATGSTSPGKRPAPTAYTAPSVAPPPSKKVKTDAAVGAGSAPRPAMAGVQGGAAGAGQAVSGRALSSDGKLGSGFERVRVWGVCRLVGFFCGVSTGLFGL
jgi:hypothetical protein